MIGLASDYDGTLSINRMVSHSTVEAVHHFQKQGNLFGIVTGRMFTMINTVIRQDQIQPDFIISSNGGMICNAKDEVVACQPIKKEVALELFYQMKELGFTSFGVTDGFRYCGYDTELDFRTVRRNRLFSSLKMDEQQLQQATQLVSFFSQGKNREHTLHLQSEIQKRFGNEVDTFMNRDSLDIVAKGVSKKTGVEQLARLLECQQMEVIGDDLNDLSMIEGLHGFAMQQGNEIVKKVARKTFDSVESCIHYLLK